MSGLERAEFHGKFLKHDCVATYVRQPSGDWLLLLKIAGKVQEITIPARLRVRACWAVSCDYIRAAVGGAHTMTRRRPAIAADGSPQPTAPRIAAGTEEGQRRSKPRRRK